VLDLSSYMGNQVYLKFYFDSVDGVANDYQGAYIDDVFIYASQPCQGGTPTPGPCVNNGDVNQSGAITAEDAQLSFAIALGVMTPTFVEFCSADCNANGEVTAGDSQGIFAAALGLGECVDPI